MAKVRITLTITHKSRRLAKDLALAGRDGLNRAADLLVAELQRVVSKPNPNRKTRNEHNAHAGEPPMTRTRAGLRSIHRTAAGRISMLAYMADLDLGTHRIEPRPWYQVTIKRLASELTKTAMGK
jgi:hypothetical protein